MITPELEPKLWAYMGGIARNIKTKALLIGGTENHVHILLSLNSSTTIAKAIQIIKGNSSKWVRCISKEYQNFQWQEGYGAFGVSISGKEQTFNYIQNQKEHHKKMTFEEEFLAFLEKHGIEYDHRYIWD